ncbi:MAG TPA: cytochrome c [Burkholderiales bacterium]|nr:cytochrome c [Burkholderiales bacterium]
MQPLLKPFVGLVLVAGIAGSASAQSPFAKPQDAIKYRQSAMFIMGQQFGRIAAVVKGKRPFDKAEVARSAAIVEEMSKLPWEGFVAGTDKGKTHAKPDIWTEAAKFKSRQEKLEQEAAKLAEVAKGGDLDAIKVQFGATGKACKSCHDDFKKKD